MTGRINFKLKYDDTTTMLCRKLSHIWFVLLLITSSALSQELGFIAPEALESVDLQDYRRVWGSPAGSFYFLRKGGFEIRQTAGGRSLMQKLGASQKLITSENGRYFALLSYNSFSPSTLSITEIKLFQSDGRLIWSRSSPGCNSFILSDAAPVAIGIAGADGLPESRILFYSATGDLQGTAKVNFMLDGQLSGDGRFFYIISAGQVLKKFDFLGHELASFPETRKCRVSYDGNLVATVKDTLVRIYRERQEVLSRTIEGKSFSDLRFSSDGNTAALLTANHLEILDLVSQTTLWRYSVEGDGFAFFHFDTDTTFSHFILGANNSNSRPEERNSTGKVALLDAHGKLLWSKLLTYAEWSLRYPEVKIEPRLRLFSLLTAERFEIYRF